MSLDIINLSIKYFLIDGLKHNCLYIIIILK